MQVSVHFNGILRQLAGSQRIVEVMPPVTAETVLAVLERDIPGLSSHLSRTACAIGDEIISRQRLLAAGEKLVLIPPVSGG